MNTFILNFSSCWQNLIYFYSSPHFSEPHSPWVNPEDENNASTSGITPMSLNQKTSAKMEADERLGKQATMASMLYANMNHSEWKTEYPSNFRI